MLRKLRETKGFTLIEVVIVIAIGALIILVVLQAVSNAQQSQRDSTRRQEASQITSALEQYAANNQGRYPDNASGVNQDVIDGGYVSDTVNDKWNGAFTGGTGSDGACSDLGSTEHVGWYRPVGSPPRDYELRICLEQGDNPVVITQDDA